MSHICFICTKPIITNYEYYVVRQAIKPKAIPYRWKIIGYAHEECGDKYKINFEYKEEVRNDILK